MLALTDSLVRWCNRQHVFVCSIRQRHVAVAALLGKDVGCRSTADNRKTSVVAALFRLSAVLELGRDMCAVAERCGIAQEVNTARVHCPSTRVSTIGCTSMRPMPKQRSMAPRRRDARAACTKSADTSATHTQPRRIMCDQSTQFSAHSNMAEPVHGDEGRRNLQVLGPTGVKHWMPDATPRHAIATCPTSLKAPVVLVGLHSTRQRKRNRDGTLFT